MTGQLCSQPMDTLLFASANNSCPVPGCELAEAEDDFDGTSWMLSIDYRRSFALSAYRREHIDFSAQSIVTNQSTETEVYEFETRWQATARLLLNVGAVYHTDRCQFSANIENLADEAYSRANLPNLFGGTIVLPELPRHYTAMVKYLF